MNIPEKQGENCWKIVYDIFENELKISTQDIRFHAVHRVGKPAAQNEDNPTSTRPRPIIARFVSREYTELVLGVKNRLKKSDRLRPCDSRGKKIFNQGYVRCQGKGS